MLTPPLYVDAACRLASASGSQYGSSFSEIREDGYYVDKA